MFFRKYEAKFLLALNSFSGYIQILDLNVFPLDFFTTFNHSAFIKMRKLRAIINSI